jgi:hypothetical protein
MIAYEREAQMIESGGKTRYLVIGYSRSGTTVVHLALKGHPNVCALNDELKPEPFFTKGISTFTHGADFKDEKEKGFSAIFDAVTRIRANENTLANGAKTACNSPELAKAVVAVLQNYLRDLKVVIILRKDLVAQNGSGIIGKKTGIMHSWYKGFEGRKIDKIKINKWRFIAYVHNVHRMYNELSKLKKTHDVLELCYEDLLSGEIEFFPKIFRFVGVPEIDPTWLSSKKVLPPPQDYITNYTGLKTSLQRYENGTMPKHVLFAARAVNHFFWRVNRFNPINNQVRRKKSK